MAPVILIIEDNEMNMKLLKSIINKAQCQVIEATDAESGILLTKIHEPDLILMDIQLPDMDGLQATRIIKQDPDLNHIPIVALTSHAMIGDDNKAKAAGCDGYITKPINTRTFMNEIFYFIRSKDEKDIEQKKTGT
ncbi:response regulator [Candidatus Competibacter phosphatis]|uniref:Response regulator n=1 Tax=Candidatus Competibacter phosphatis TaxID=221280 RepID=A0ABX1TND2_9GAMM|nr:response regulator [Candidatus Competibacter phosphatis]NMQ19410.1 response regulator [Candidatus Competibacter phosphatis]